MWYGFIGLAGGSQTVFIYNRAYDFKRLEAERASEAEKQLYRVNPAFLVGLSKY
jgi:hypothetical protein